MISNEKLFEVAVAYYIKDMSQKEIAEDYGVSRVQISKYLKLAEERGIVEITINPPNVSKEDEEKYQLLFNKYFGLKKLILVPGAHNADKAHPFLINFAAKWLADNIENTQKNIGIGWGRTIYDLSGISSGAAKKSDWTYYPLTVLLSKDVEDYFNYSRILSNFVRNFGGQADTTFMDALNYPGTGMEDFVNRYWARLETIVCGIGHAFTRFPGVRTQSFSKEVADAIQSKDLVGDFINYYFDINGEIFHMLQSERTIPLDILKAVPRKIAIAGGYQKVESIIGALRASLVDILISDIKTVQHILEYLG